MKKVKSVSVKSVGKLFGIMYLVMGLIAGFIIAVMAFVGSSRMEGGRGIAAPILAVIAIIFFPLLYGAIGYIAGLFSGWVYNIAAKWTGGLEVEIEE